MEGSVPLNIGFGSGRPKTYGATLAHTVIKKQTAEDAIQNPKNSTQSQAITQVWTTRKSRTKAIRMRTQSPEVKQLRLQPAMQRVQTADSWERTLQNIGNLWQTCPWSRVRNTGFNEHMYVERRFRKTEGSRMSEIHTTETQSIVHI